jgi:hypothetical protein
MRGAGGGRLSQFFASVAIFFLNGKKKTLIQAFLSWPEFRDFFLFK